MSKSMNQATLCFLCASIIGLVLLLSIVLYALQQSVLLNATAYQQENICIAKLLDKKVAVANIIRLDGTCKVRGE